MDKLFANVMNGLSNAASQRATQPQINGVAALYAFAHTPNNLREISIEESLSELKSNMVIVKGYCSDSTHQGSGLMVTSCGYVLTAHHVVEEALKEHKKITVTTKDRKSYDISPGGAWYIKEKDIALLDAHKPVAYSRPIRAKVSLDGIISIGERISVIGYRDGQEYTTWGEIIDSHITGRDGSKRFDDIFLTNSLGINGESGGIIANSDGELAGIVVAGHSRYDRDLGYICGINIKEGLKLMKHVASTRSKVLFARPEQ